VYAQPGHEFYRRWVGLVDNTEGAADAGVQGYLRLSVAVWGAGDAPTPREDLARERRLARDAAALTSARRRPLGLPAPNAPPSRGLPPLPIEALRMPLPEISKKLQFVVVTMHRGEHLPGVDFNSFTGKIGIDAFMEVWTRRWLCDVFRVVQSNLLWRSAVAVLFVHICLPVVVGASRVRAPPRGVAVGASYSEPEHGAVDGL
jgi:hypothetical protein